MQSMAESWPASWTVVGFRMEERAGRLEKVFVLTSVDSGQPREVAAPDRAALRKFLEEEGCQIERAGRWVRTSA